MNRPPSNFSTNRSSNPTARSAVTLPRRSSPVPSPTRPGKPSGCLNAFDPAGRGADTSQVDMLTEMLIPVSLSQYLLPEEAGGQRRSKTVRIALILSITVAALTVVAAPSVIGFVLPKYNDAVSSIQIMSISIIPITITSILSSRMLAKEDSTTVFIGTLIYAGILPLIMLIPFRLYSSELFAYSILISSAAQALFLFLAARNKNLHVLWN